MKIGELVGGRFELEELVGSGGMSSVYRAYDTLLERLVAIKILHDHYARDPDHVERFRREARAIAKLAHPNVVTVIDRGEHDGRQYIVFEHVSGENLKELVEREGPLPVRVALELVHQAARGLAFAHEHGIVHRDVKPHNVLVDEEGTAKVTDFGIARSLESEGGLTQTGTLLGTSDYIAPEQARGDRADERSDQYSLGVLFYELLTGEVPYPGDSFMAVAMRHVNDPIPSVRAARAEVPGRVDELLRRALAKDPDDRFPSMEALIGALEACLAAETQERPVPLPFVPRGFQRRQRRRPALLAGLAAAVAVAALVGGLVAAVGGDETPEAAGERGDGPAPAAPLSLSALADYDPFGDDHEHPEAVERATDGDESTYWTTESYRSFSKDGVGLVLDAGTPQAPARIEVVTDTPGFRARIDAGPRADGGFVAVSGERILGARTTFPLDSGGSEYRYYLVWITDPNGRAHVNEVRVPRSY